MGVAVWGHDEPVAETLCRADQALYRGKAAGRNRVELDASGPGNATLSSIKGPSRQSA